MSNLGPAEILVGVVFWIIALYGFKSAAAARQGIRVSPLVMILRKFSLNKLGPELIHIEARRRGFWAWLMAVFGIHSGMVWKVTKESFQISRLTVNDKEDISIPLSSISFAQVGRSRYVTNLVAAALCFAFSILIVMFSQHNGTEMAGASFLCGILLVIAVILVVNYFDTKSISLAIQTHSGSNFSIRLKRGTIDGVCVDDEKAKEIGEVLNQLIEQSKAEGANASSLAR